MPSDAEPETDPVDSQMPADHFAKAAAGRRYSLRCRVVRP